MKSTLFLLAVFIVPLAFVSLNMAGCSTQGGDEKKLPMEIVMDGTFSSIDEKREVLINNNEQLQSLMNDVYRNLDQKPNIPTVDFAKNSVIAVFLGTRSNGGYMVAIDSINESSGSISVNITETTPGKDCVVTEAITRPFSIVKIPKTDKKPVFNTKRIVKDCK